ncbi:MAG: hypothetical protein RMK84_04310 [Oscillochloridaceae bacterium]|nr:hypothetical protein [Chloroflexaceae bacterium]MDW8389326.1 hypothetical protein [Oscillochloridaceae bacterium]
MDQECYEDLARRQLANVCLIALEDFERDDAALVAVKSERSLAEYYFTCTPSLPLYIFRHFPEQNIITYLDADLFFLSDPGPLFDELGPGSIGIIEHRLPAALRHLEMYGIYNVGWITFRRDEQGLACLQWWRERCIEWCYDRVEPGRFADQKYLDHWPALFPGVRVLQHKGANVAPWNVSRYKLTVRGRQIFVDDQPLLFYHFHGLNQVRPWLYNPRLSYYQLQMSDVLLKVYEMYIQILQQNVHEDATPASIRIPQRSMWKTYLDVLLGRYIYVADGRCHRTNSIGPMVRALQLLAASPAP